MTTYAIRRILQTIPILFIISILLFFLVRSCPRRSADLRAPQSKRHQGTDRSAGRKTGLERATAGAVWQVDGRNVVRVTWANRSSSAALSPR